MSSEDQDKRVSLVDRLLARGRKTGRLAATAGQGETLTLIEPMAMAHALEEMSRRCGRPAEKAMLMAALPVSEGDIDSRFAPIALARAGLEARWSETGLGKASADDLPMLAPLQGWGAVIIIGLDAARGTVTLVDAAGEREERRADIEAVITGELLVCGHADPENGMGFEEERSFVRRNPRLWMLGVFLSERRRLMKVVVAAAFMNLCALALPLYMRAIYDRVVPNLAIESLWALSVGVVMALCFEFLFKHVRSSFVDAIGLRVAQAVQHRAMTSFLHGRMLRRSSNVGSLMNALRDVETLALLVPQMLVTFVVDVPFFFGFVALIAMIGGFTVAGPLLGAAGLVFVGLVCAYASKLAARKTSKLFQARNNLVVDASDGLATIKANQAEGRFLRQWDIVSDHIGVSSRSTRKWNDLPGSLSGLLVQMVTVVVIVVGVFQIKSGAMTTGAMIAVSMLAGRAMAPISSAISLISRGYQSLTQFAGLADLLSLEPEREVSDPSIKLRPVQGEFRLRTVSFTHEGAVEPSLRDISLQIRPGEKIALIGRSGSGKSTLLQLLSGLFEPQAGAISLDGHAMGHYAASHLRRDIVHCGQDAILFDTTIWDNILLGLEEPDEAVVQEAVRAAGLDSFVERSVEGYSRKVGPRGQRLSGGQRQSILLARALVRNPGVLLLDEPTASMDVNSEQAVINGLRTATKGKTLIVATHRMALLDVVDRIIWLEEGRIVVDKPRLEVLNMMRTRQQDNHKAA